MEVKRQVFHIVLGLIIVILLYFKIINVQVLFVIFIVGVLFSIASHFTNVPIVDWFLKNFGREKEFPGRGAMFFFLGILVVLILFEKNIALASIMVLTLGDSISHLVGRYYHKTRASKASKKKKLLEGTAAGIIAGFLGALIFVNFLAALLGSVVAMMVEAWEIRYKKIVIDDNFTIPLVAGIVMWLVYLLI